jgi:hypothetical protein
MVYYFLIERSHAIRAPYVQRLRDRVWLFFMIGTTVSFLAIFIVGLCKAITVISPEDGICRIGQPLAVTICILTVDTVVNIVLTAIFVYSLAQSMSFRLAGEGETRWTRVIRCWNRLLRLETPDPSANPNMQRYSTQATGRAIRRLAKKSTLGAFLTILSTTVNLGILAHTRGYEEAWFCLTTCSIDGKLRDVILTIRLTLLVTWSCCVIHWMTWEAGKPNYDSTEQELPSFVDSISQNKPPLPLSSQSQP